MSYLEESLARIQQIITALGNIERDHNTRYAKWLIKNMNKQNPELLPAARKIRLRFGSVFRMLDWAQRNITGDMVIAYAPAVLPLSGPRTKGKTMLQFVGDGK
jgi:DNA primase